MRPCLSLGRSFDLLGYSNDQLLNEIDTFLRDLLEQIRRKVQYTMCNVALRVEFRCTAERRMARDQHIDQYADVPHVRGTGEWLVVHHFRRFKAERSRVAQGDDDVDERTYRESRWCPTFPIIVDWSAHARGRNRIV